jgi:hypothetical protein
MINARWRFLVLSTALIVSTIAASFVPGAAAQDATPTSTSTGRSVEWTRFDVELDLRADGLLRVTERQEVAFHGGPYTNGYATIPLRNIEAIEDVRVSEESPGGQLTPYIQVSADATTTTPNTYRVQTQPSFVNVDFWFVSTTDANRTFVLQYDVHGALRSSMEDGIRFGEIWWTAISADVTTTAPVRASTVTLRLPAAVDPARVLLSPMGYVPTTSGDWSVWTWTRTNLSAGDEFTVRLKFPAIILPMPSATPTG